MALPASDTFAGTGALSASWTNAVNALTRVGGVAEVTVDDVDNLSFWNADSFNNDQKSSIVVAATQTSGALFIGPAVRCNAASGGNGYIFDSDGASGAGHSEFAKIVSGTYSALKTVAVTFTVGDTMELRVAGTTLSLYKNTVFVDSTTDASLTAGAAGIYAFHSGGAAAGGIDSWSADNNAAAPPTTAVSEPYYRRRRRMASID